MIRFSPKQNRVFLNFCARVVLLIGAIRSGKTFVSYFLFSKSVKRVRDAGLTGDIVIIGKTERTVVRNIINPMIRLFGDINVRYTRGTGELKFFDELVYVIGASDERAEEKIRGMTIALCLGDEVTLWPEAVYVQLMGRMSEEGAQAILTTNPDSPFHWLKVKYIDRAKGSLYPEEDQLDMEVYHFTLQDNITLSLKYISNICKEYVGVFYRRFILGEWCIAEGLIYDMFDPDIHVFPNDLIGEFPKTVDYFVAVDYGTGTVTTVGLFGTDKLGNDYLLRTYRYEPTFGLNQKADPQLKVELIKLLEDYQYTLQDAFCTRDENNNYIPTKELEAFKFPRNIYTIPVYVDPSAASFIAQLSSKDPVAFPAVLKANNKVLDGIRYVASRLYNRKFFLHRSNIAALEEFSTYSWDPAYQTKGEDKPIKRADHEMDKIRYGLYSRAVPRKRKAKVVGRTKQ